MRPEEDVFNTAIEQQELLKKVPFSADFKPSTDVIQKKFLVPVNSVTKLQCFMFIPKNTVPASTYFYIPGTACAAYSLEADTAVCSNLAKHFNWRVIVMFHRLSQQNKHPIPLNDINNCINAFLQNHREFSIDLNTLVIGGFSSGALLSLNICLLANQRKGMPFSKILLIAPAVSLADRERPYDKDAPWMKKEFFDLMVRNFMPEGVDPALPAFSPLSNQADAFKNFPPITLIYGQNDCLKDEVIEFIRHVSSSVSVTAFELPGKNHGFPWEDFNYMRNIRDTVVRNQQARLTQSPLIPVRLFIYPYPEIAAYGQPPPFDERYFVNRTLLTQALNQHLLQRRQQMTPKTVRLTGDGGLGKTLVGLFYYHYSYPFYNFRIWIIASDIESVGHQYKDLGLTLKLVNETDDLPKCVAVVNNWLENQTDYLVVFDDVDPARLQNLRRYVPNGGHKLIISRSKQTLFKDEFTITVSMMSKDEAIKLFKKKNNANEETAELLAQRVNCIPLGIRLATDYMRSQKLEPSAYLALFDKTQQRIQQDGVSVCLDITVKRIIALSEEAKMVLYCCCFLSPYQIPLEILNGLVKKNFIDSEAYKLLVKDFSILTIGELKDKTALFNIHPWIQETIRSKFIDNKCYIQSLNQLLSIFSGIDDSLLTNRYYKHLHTVLQEIETIQTNLFLFSEINKVNLALAYCKLSFIHLNFKNTHDAIKSAKSAEPYLELCDDSQKIIIMKAVVYSHWPFGDAELALQKAATLKEFCKERSLYFEAAKICHSQAMYAGLLGQLKESCHLLAEANQYSQQAIKNPLGNNVQMIRLGQAKTLVMLSYSYRDLYKIFEDTKDEKLYVDNSLRALEEANAIWEAVEREVDNNDKALVNKLNEVKQHIITCYGVAFLKQNKYEKAAEYFREATLLATQQYGELNRMTLMSKMELAFTFDNLQSAIQHILSVMNDKFKLFPNDNMDIADSYRYIGDILARHHRSKEAYYFYKRSYFLTKMHYPKGIFENHFKTHILTNALKKCQQTLAAEDSTNEQEIQAASIDSEKATRDELILRLKALLQATDNVTDNASPSSASSFVLTRNRL